jgi:hypothetical protein
VTQRRALALGIPLLSLLFAASPALADEGGDSAPPAEEDAALPVNSEPGRGSDIRDMLHLDVGPLSLAPVVLLQVQAIPYVGDESFVQAGDPSERGGFRLRRARFGFAGRLYGRVPFKVTAEYSSDDAGTARLLEAWFGYDKFKPFSVFAGARDVPFSRSALIDAGSSALIERPLAVRAMAPFQQLGVSAEGRLFSGILNYAVGVYNGLQRTDQFFQGYTANAALLGNRFEGLTYAARLSSDPFGRPGRAALDLYHDKLRLSLGGSFFFSNGGTRDILGAGGDVLLHYRGLHVLGEFLMNRSNPRENPTQQTNQLSPVQSLGAVGEVGYAVLRKRLGITARFEWLNPNTKAEDESDCWLVTGGVSYHVLGDLLRAQVDFTHRQEIHGQSLKNDALVLQLQLNL